MVTKKDRATEALLQSQALRDIKAHQCGDLKHFLLSYLLFRAYILFRNGKKFHPYGNEHRVTYNQLRYQKIDNFFLDREKGYCDLINMIEKRFRGMFTVAKIYSRHPGEESFNTLCRHYDSSGQLVEVQDPVLQDDLRILPLFYFTHEGRVFITDRDPAVKDESLPDFKTLVDAQLKTATR